MKRLFISMISLFAVVFCQAQEKAEKTAMAEKSKEEKMKMKEKDKSMDKMGPYKASYSSNFKIGNQAYSKIVLDLWKDWDDNEFDRHDYFADTIVMMFADGTVTKGKKENMDAAKKFRASLGSAKSTIHAWVPLRSMDRNEDVVCVWGQEEDTMPDGKVEKRDIHEVWWFNKDGKVTALRQWNAKFGEMPQ